MRIVLGIHCLLTAIFLIITQIDNCDVTGSEYDE